MADRNDSSRLEISETDVAKRRRFVGLEADDLERIAAIRPLVSQHADTHTALFFDYLMGFDEAAQLARRPDLLAEARRLKREHLIAMVGGDYGPAYVEQRFKLALIYSRVELDLRVFLGAFHHLMQSIGDGLMEKGSGTPLENFKNFMSLKKVAFFDLGVIIDLLIDERERTISAQQTAIRELSTPVLQLRERLLVLPIIGMIDSHRGLQLTESLLTAIRANRAKVVVMDITGVAAVDSKVSNHLVQTVAAARLMGAKVIVTGLSAEVALALVALGVDLGTMTTVGDLQGGIEMAERMLGYKVVRTEESVPT